MSLFKRILKRSGKSDLVELEISGSIPEESAKISIPFVKVKKKITTLDLHNIFDYLMLGSAKYLLLNIKPLTIGLAKANFIREKIIKLSLSGVKTIAYMENPGNIEYFIGSAADSVYLPKWSTLNTIGLSSDTFYLNNLINKAYIEPEFISKGNYKSASEMFMRSDMSEYNKEMVTSILEQSYNLIISKISESRKLSFEKVSELFDSGPYLSADALDNKLVDGVSYCNEVKSNILDCGESDNSSKTDAKVIKSIKFKKTIRKLKNKVLGKKLTIAVVVVDGMITDGESKGGGSGFKSSGSASVVKSLKEAEKDKSVAGIILRVLSPGGSALASDIIRNEISRINEKIPVVISMSDVAASGGYMLSLSANKIFADEFTLTGSIGVISGKFNISKLLNFLEVGHQNISFGKNASIYSPLKKLTDEEYSFLIELVENMYDGFVSLVSESRDIPLEETEKVSQGRVWTGAQAKTHNLIDETGNFSDAVNYLISEIGEVDKDKIVFKSISKKVDILSSSLNKNLSSKIADYISLLEIVNKQKVLALMPFIIKIR